MLPGTKSSEREAGFTLVELLIAICLSGIVIVALTTGFIAILKGTATAHDTLVASNGSHTLATYLTADVESANPDYTSNDPTATMGCATPPTGTTTNVLRLQWSEMTTSTQLRAFSVSYRIRASDTNADTVNDKWELVRYACSASKDPFTTTMATVLGTGTLTEHVLVDELSEPTGSSVTKATIEPTTRVVTLEAFAALVKGDTAPYFYSFSATMRTPKPAPWVVSITRNGAATTSAATVAWTVKFSEAVTGVDAADFAFTYTGGLTGASVASGGVTGSGTTWTVTANTGSGQGTLALTVDDNDTILSTTDNDPLGGSGIDNGNYTGGGYTVDRQAPSVTVTQATGQADPASTLPILFTATFDDNVTGLGDQTTDIVNTGTAAGATFTVTGSGKVYTISVSGLTGNGTVIPSIVPGAAKDSAGNDNAASTSGGDPQVTYSTAGPTPTIASVDLWNGGGAAGLGKIGQGDKVIVTFSGAMSESSLCSTWTGASTDRLEDGNNKVTVTVTNGAAGANDQLTVTTGSPVCSSDFNFGSINLGSGAYVSTNTDFKGSSANVSKIEWSAATKTLTITLGAPSTAPTASVATSAPIYTADTDIRTSTGGTINNSPLTLANEQQF